MFNIEHQTILLITILTILITIVFFLDESKHNCKRMNETVVPIRQYKPQKRRSPKKIHNSENFKNNDKNISLDDKQKKLSKNIKNSKSIKNITPPTDELKNIIVLFYSDNCYHCHNFFPTWLKIKENMDGSNIKFDEINCTNSDPGLSYIDGFPTIAIYNKNNDHIMNYDRDRSYDNFKQFLENL